MKSARLAQHPRAHAALQYWLGKGYDKARPTDVDESRKGVWFAGGRKVDEEVTQRFGADVAALQAGQYEDWGQAYDGLAYVIIADQLSRNVHRGTAASVALDERALRRAEAMLASGEAERVRPAHRTWLVMPYMHSEQLTDQQTCVQLCEAMEAECAALDAGGSAAKMFAANASFARRHLAVIERFGRFPHRNALLGRQATEAEASALSDGSVESF
ncbi:hypothetical protein WJX81_006061 [Elliptochloris bilobata]|uniref:DUF924 domain-containing protein n=1 Tax=Elliptochloris bilobata TaxID=381761 RepID=A0AAW1RHH7_9CHLO